MAGTLSISTMNGNKDTTQESTFATEVMSEINDIKEPYGSVLPIVLK